MASVFVREQNSATHSGSKTDTGPSFTRTFLVRTDCVENISTVSGYVGIVYGSAHPESADSFMTSFETSVADDSGLLYTVKLNYEPLKPDEQDPEEEPSEEPGNVPGLSRRSVWGASSSVSTGPVFQDLALDIISNTAGDPLEGLSREFADFKLTLTQYYLTDDEWTGLAATYTNTTNDAEWNGCPVDTWKCQGCSAKLSTESIKDEFDVETITKFWEVSWEFAYRKETWALKVWDVGLSEKMDDTGEPNVNGTGKMNIKGQDGKAVKSPVALHLGIAKLSGDAGWPKPDELSFVIYDSEDFGAVFGEIHT